MFFSAVKFFLPRYKPVTNTFNRNDFECRIFFQVTANFGEVHVDYDSAIVGFLKKLQAKPNFLDYLYTGKLY